MVATVTDKFDQLSSMMHEKLKRHWAACEAMVMGRGGISAVAQATGMSRTTIRRGIDEIEKEFPQLANTQGAGRIRQPGGGRRSLAANDVSLQADLDRLVEPATRGSSTSPLLWTSKSA